MSNSKFVYLRTKYLMYIARLSWIKMNYDLQDNDTRLLVESIESAIQRLAEQVAKRQYPR